MCLAVPLRVTGVEPGGQRGTVEMGNAALEVSMALLSDVKPGDYVLVHAGMAIEKLDEQAARETLALLDEVLRAGGAKT
jgi:hydrogenase expression/formation protein HypC